MWKWVVSFPCPKCGAVCCDPVEHAMKLQAQHGCVVCASTSGPSTHLCKGILWLCWDANWEIPLCLFRSYQLIVQHLEWLITTQVVVRVLVHMLVHMLDKNMTKPLFHRWWLNPPFWHVFVRPHGIHQMLKWGSWHVGHVAIMLSFMLYLNMGLNSYIKAQKSSLDWWCHLHIGRYCWIEVHNAKLSAHFGYKKMHALLSAHV